MGWFWADSTPSTARRTPQPPRECPVKHPSSALPPSSISSSASSSSCPYVPADGQTPVSITSTTTFTTSHTESSPPPSSTTFSKLNPLNYMPSFIPQSRAPNQKQALPVEREISTIPKGDGSGQRWEYPSPQQMYNAMLRKGYTDTPEDAVESMVAVHNFLNEGAWNEIRAWERRFQSGLVEGWRRCSRGEEGLEEEWESHVAFEPSSGTTSLPATQQNEPQLVRFMGRPRDMTPKAQFNQALAWLYPAKFSSEPPFDRHDWFVQRTLPDGSKREVRYVIDYYSGEPEPSGEEVFYLDVRPAVDSPRAAAERTLRWGGDMWWRASGGIAREVAEMRRKAEEEEKARKDGW